MYPLSYFIANMVPLGEAAMISRPSQGVPIPHGDIEAPEVASFQGVTKFRATHRTITTERNPNTS